MSIEVRNVTKTFRTFTALQEINLRVNTGAWAFGMRQDHPAENLGRLGGPDDRFDSAQRSGSHRSPYWRTWRGVRLSALRPVSSYDRF